MRPIILLLVLISLRSSAQTGRLEVHTDSGRVVLHHFPEGGISTLEWKDLDDRWGRSIAFDRTGAEIYSNGTRRIGGHATVQFTHHPDGGVAKAEFSSAPDGGIQWYRSVTTFDRNGKRRAFRNMAGMITDPFHALHYSFRSPRNASGCS
jgi:hypothetical protein